MADNSGGPFRVIYSERIRQRVRSLGADAMRLGIGQEFIDALKEITERLASDPIGWGDPQYRLCVLDLLNCHRIFSIFHVTYAVDEERRLVYLKEIEPCPGHPPWGR